MRPTVIANANASATAGPNGGSTTTNTNGITIPINHEYAGGAPPHHAQYADASTGAYGSPNSRQQPQQQQHYPTAHQPQQQTHPAQHFQQGFGFDNDMDMDMNMFPRTRLGRMHHDPFADFGTSHFGFPQFGSLGRRRAGDHMNEEHDFFNRMPTEFRQYIPEGFATHRRGVPTQHQQQPQQGPPPPQQQQQPQPQYYQNYVQPGTTPPPNGMTQPQSPSKKLCDAAIQTEDMERSEVDSAAPSADNLRQHGLRNTVDMGVKSAAESEMHGPRAHSAPPPEQLQQQQQQQQQHQQQQQMPVNGKRQTPPPQPQFGTQTSPSVQQDTRQPPFQRAYFAPQQTAHPQQKQHTPPPQQPQTPGGTYVRTIPIFVEGRSEPIINHREIPNQQSAPSASGAQASASTRAHAPPQQQYHQQAPQQQHYQQHPQQQQQPPHPQQQQQHRPTPLNTQQQAQQPPQAAGAAGAAGAPPQTPHTLDSIGKIQDIQRDVLDLMTKVEQFKGTRKEKEYAYLDEMLTRNLLKLDTIDTNGKDSIRLARKEAIKCIQASINVLEAKAEENARAAAGNPAATAAAEQADSQTANATAEAHTSTRKSGSGSEVTKETADAGEAGHTEAQPAKTQEPIPLPPPESMQVDETRQDGGADSAAERSTSSSSMAAAASATAEAT